MVTVTAEPSTMTLSVLTANQSGQPVPFTSGSFGSFVYLRADVAGKSGYGYPTGRVTFSDSFGAIPYSPTTYNLNSEGNTAFPNGIYVFDTGTHAISASYSGDLSFSPSNSTQSPTFTISPGFYTAAAGGQGQIVISAPGGSGQSGVDVWSSTGYSGTISLACSGLPSEATCTFVPATISATGTISMTESAILVRTTAATTSLNSTRRTNPLGPWLLGLGIFCSALLAGGKRRCGRELFLLVMLTVAILLPSCGGGGSSSQGPPPNSGTPAGTYNVVVNASSGSTTSATQFTLVVQ
jgi:hypothetical protein